jgi:ABC-type polysaccharide/polyol phosphate export permease
VGAAIGVVLMIVSGTELVLAPQDLIPLAVMLVGFACIFGSLYVVFRD